MNQKWSGGAMPFDSRGSIKLKPGTVPGLRNKQTNIFKITLSFYEYNYQSNKYKI